MKLYKFIAPRPPGGCLCVVLAPSRERALALAKAYATDLEAEFNFPRGTCSSWLSGADVSEREVAAEGVIAYAEC